MHFLHFHVEISRGNVISHPNGGLFALSSMKVGQKKFKGADRTLRGLATFCDRRSWGSVLFPRHPRVSRLETRGSGPLFPTAGRVCHPLLNLLGEGVDQRRAGGEGECPKVALNLDHG